MKGAKYLIQEGVLENIEQMWGFHNRATLPKGGICYKSGEFLSSTAKINITVNSENNSKLTDFCSCNEKIYKKIKNILTDNISKNNQNESDLLLYLCRVTSSIGNI